MRNSYGNFKEAAGIFYEDRFVPLIEAVLNILISIICCKIWGLAGVFMGTIASGLVLWCYSYPKYVYKKQTIKATFTNFKNIDIYSMLSEHNKVKFENINGNTHTHTHTHTQTVYVKKKKR